MISQAVKGFNCTNIAEIKLYAETIRGLKTASRAASLRHVATLEDG
jgi:hypothetical protein